MAKPIQYPVIPEESVTDEYGSVIGNGFLFAEPGTGYIIAKHTGGTLIESMERTFLLWHLLLIHYFESTVTEFG